tara:strand:+ start:625 stop:1056 length:432 start_codon:yes stop_codon:yes gene_type:complete
MNKLKKYFFIILILLTTNSFAEERFFEKGKKLYNEGKIKESKFLFQRSIVFNPKHSNSYLYLAKIYETEENEIEEEKNLNTTLLLDPNNEEAIYMLINIKLEKSDIKKVKELTEKFQIICETLCSKLNSIDERLSNIDVNNES